jgi:uncharacterized protein
MKQIARKEYLNWLIRWKEQEIIKVVSGVRRCGKSTLLALFREYLLQHDVGQEQIILINFEDIEFEDLTDYRLLYEYIKKQLQPDKMNYVFLDEIQHVKQFEKVVDSLFIKPDVDVYITGSNAYYMSGELATLLSGRYVELKMLPLSFREFSSAYEGQGISKAEQFNMYLQNGSFPYITKFQHSKRESGNYLRDIYNSVLLKDVVARLKIADVTSLENITKFLMHNIGSKVSPAKIANTLKSQKKNVDQKTVDKYIRGLTDSLLFYKARRYNIKGKQFLTTLDKYYVVDIGLRNMLIKGKDSDAGHILENVVYLELLRRGYEGYVGEVDAGEVDFVADNGNGIVYYQVAVSALEESTLKRELAPLRKIQDNYPKYLLTLDEIFATANYEGILKINVLEWLLQDI